MALSVGAPLGCSPNEAPKSFLPDNPAPAQTQATPLKNTVFNFDSDKQGEAPKGFSTAKTGTGGDGKWIVRVAADAPSGSQVLAQVSDDATGYRFPVIVNDAISAKDVDLSVKFKPISGRVDQAAGIVWRYRDQDNYYIVRANANENNVVLYKVEKGQRADLPLVGEGRTYGKSAPVPSGKWSTLRVNVKGQAFEVFVNGQRLYAVEDATFKDAGKVGLWTKADSVTEFDEFSVKVSG